MTTSARRIGLLTAGGDCPGLNAVVRAVTKSASNHGIEVVGIADGFLGLLEDRCRPLSFADVSGILSAGGTILGSSNKANPSRVPSGTDSAGKLVYEDRSDIAMTTLRRHGLDTLVVAGGDGSMTIAGALLDHCSTSGGALNIIGLPKTIDNDLFGTDITFGFQTAVSIATEAIDRVHTTAASHHRVMAVEVMGRNAGWLALHAGIASGSDIILIPELPFQFDHMAETVRARHQRGSRYSIICVAEGARPAGGAQVVARHDPTSPDPIRLGGIGKFVADTLEGITGIESRYVVLGHVQRGGQPVAADRVLSTRLGHHAIELIVAGVRNRMVAVRAGEVIDIALTECCGRQRTVPIDHPLIAAATAVGVSFGTEVRASEVKQGPGRSGQ